MRPLSGKRLPPDKKSFFLYLPIISEEILFSSQIQSLETESLVNKPSKIQNQDANSSTEFHTKANNGPVSEPNLSSDTLPSSSILDSNSNSEIIDEETTIQIKNSNKKNKRKKSKGNLNGGTSNTTTASNKMNETSTPQETSRPFDNSKFYEELREKTRVIRVQQRPSLFQYSMKKKDLDTDREVSTSLSPPNSSSAWTSPYLMFLYDQEECFLSEMYDYIMTFLLHLNLHGYYNVSSLYSANNTKVDEIDKKKEIEKIEISLQTLDLSSTTSTSTKLFSRPHPSSSSSSQSIESQNKDIDNEKGQNNQNVKNKNKIAHEEMLQISALLLNIYDIIIVPPLQQNQNAPLGSLPYSKYAYIIEFCSHEVAQIVYEHLTTSNFSSCSRHIDNNNFNRTSGHHISLSPEIVVNYGNRTYINGPHIFNYRGNILKRQNEGEARENSTGNEYNGRNEEGGRGGHHETRRIPKKTYNGSDIDALLKGHQKGLDNEEAEILVEDHSDFYYHKHRWDVIPIESLLLLGVKEGCYIDDLNVHPHVCETLLKVDVLPLPTQSRNSGKSEKSGNDKDTDEFSSLESESREILNGNEDDIERVQMQANVSNINTNFNTNLNQNQVNDLDNVKVTPNAKLLGMNCSSIEEIASYLHLQIKYHYSTKKITESHQKEKEEEDGKGNFKVFHQKYDPPTQYSSSPHGGISFIQIPSCSVCLDRINSLAIDLPRMEVKQQTKNDYINNNSSNSYSNTYLPTRTLNPFTFFKDFFDYSIFPSSRYTVSSYPTNPTRTTETSTTATAAATTATTVSTTKGASHLALTMEEQKQEGQLKCLVCTKINAYDSSNISGDNKRTPRGGGGGGGCNNRIRENDVLALQCNTCEIKENLWICILCGHIGCGRYTAEHAKGHFSSTGELHGYSLELVTKRIWDYVADSFVHDEEKRKEELDNQMSRYHQFQSLRSRQETSSSALTGESYIKEEDAGEDSLTQRPFYTSQETTRYSSYLSSMTEQDYARRNSLESNLDLDLSSIHPSTSDQQASSTSSVNEPYKEEKLVEISQLYDALIASQLEEQRRYYNELISRTLAEFTEAIIRARQVKLTEKETTEMKTLKDSITSLENTNNELKFDLLSEEEKFRQLHGLNSNLMTEQKTLQDQINQLTNDIETVQEETSHFRRDLEEQCNDLRIAISMRENEAIQGGDVVGVYGSNVSSSSNQQTSDSSSSRKTKKQQRKKGKK